MKNIFPLAFIKKGFWVSPSMRLTTNKSPSQGKSYSSSLWLLEDVGVRIKGFKQDGGWIV